MHDHVSALLKESRVIDGNVGTSVVHDRKKESRTQSSGGGARSSRLEDSRGNEGHGHRERIVDHPLPPARSRDDPLDADRPQSADQLQSETLYLSPVFSAFFPSGAVAARCFEGR